MDLPQFAKPFFFFKSSESCESNMKTARFKTVGENEINENGYGNRNLWISINATWIKGSHISLYGLTSVISVDTGIILDVQCMLKYVHMCSTIDKNLQMMRKRHNGRKIMNSQRSTKRSGREHGSENS